ncbi:hypothetical protein VTH06DRAFT_6169 [Thermothelomyces fergusii]
MASSSPSAAAPSWRKIQIPRPLQRLFDSFPLRIYEPNELPERSRRLTSGDLPTLYVFSTESDARLGLPSFNPTCLKWQTLLRLAGLDFRTAPSTNHASPTGSLPFLLPPRTSPAPTTTSPAPAPVPVPASDLLSFARKHRRPARPTIDGAGDGGSELPSLPGRARAYLALVTHSLRAAWLCALYLDPGRGAVLRRLYVDPASSSRAVRAALLRRLRRAAAEQVATIAAGAGGNGVDEEAVYRSAGAALDALAGLLRESGTAWFFGAERPGAFDAALFSYTHLMVEYMSEEEEEEQDEEKERTERARSRREAGGRPWAAW